MIQNRQRWKVKDINNEINSLLKQIKDLETQALSLKNQREAVHKTLKRWSDERNALNLIVRKKWKEINILKNKRDEINLSVQKLKKNEALILSHLDAKKSRYADLSKRPNLNTYTTLKNEIEIQKKINDLDWKIQTTRFSRIEEEEIIDKIRRLEEQLLLKRKALNLKKEKDDLFSTIKEFSVYINTIHRIRNITIPNRNIRITI